jgi:hypothetical protein
MRGTWYFVEALHYKPEVAGSIPSGRNVTLVFDSASNRNEYQGYLLGG